MQSLKKIHAWAQMKVPLLDVLSFDFLSLGCFAISMFCRSPDGSSVGTVRVLDS